LGVDLTASLAQVGAEQGLPGQTRTEIERRLRVDALGEAPELRSIGCPVRGLGTSMAS